MSHILRLTVCASFCSSIDRVDIENSILEAEVNVGPLKLMNAEAATTISQHML
jgi:hypothetical protein